MSNKQNKCLQNCSILNHIRSYLEIHEILKTRNVNKSWFQIDTIPIDFYKSHKKYFNIKYLSLLKIVKAKISLNENNFYQIFNFVQRNHLHLQYQFFTTVKFFILFRPTKSFVTYKYKRLVRIVI